MMDHNGFPVYPGWKTVGRLGSGSFGAVYEIERDLFGVKEKAALKQISIPRDEGEVEELFANGYTAEGVSDHYRAYLAEIVREYQLMLEMKGHTNVVYCDDIRYEPKNGGFGWDIYIKMELLQPLMKHLNRVSSEEQILKLARDMASALVLCRSKNIIHRDIKPQNIFLSKDGDFKLGDFGIAKTAEKTSGGTRIGTYNYMAPEVYHNRPYGHTADLYSLGLVLYWLLNERRLPFYPLPPAVPRHQDEERARLRRLSGEPLPPPAHGSEGLKRIVLRACAFDPRDRYATAEEMLQELDALSAAQTRRGSRPAAAGAGAQAEGTARFAPGKNRETGAGNARPAPDPRQGTGGRAPGRRRWLPAAAAVLALAMLLGAGTLLLRPKGLQLRALEALDDEAAALLPEGSSCVGYYRIGGRDGQSESLEIPVQSGLEGRTLTLWLLSGDGEQSRQELPVLDGKVTVGLSGGSRALLLAPTAELPEEGWEPWQDALPQGRLLDERAQALRESRIRVRETCFSEDPNLAGWDAEGIAEVDYGPWGPWQLTEIQAAEDLEVETGTVYRSRTRESTTSQTPLGEDWELELTRSDYGDWGPWSDWSESARGQSESCNVQTRTQYRWVKKDLMASIPESPNKQGWAAVAWGAWEDDEASAMSSAPEASPLSRIETETRTLYRVQERSVQHTYTYSRWGEWSDWSTEAAEETEELQVETAAGWRSREIRHSYSYGDWSPWQLSEIETAEDLDVETGTLYRFRERESLASQTSPGGDWQLQDTRAEYGAWGSWSDWSESARSQSDTRNVQTKTQYRWVEQSKLAGDWEFYSAGAWADDEASAMADAPDVGGQSGMTTGMTQYRVVTETRTLYRSQERSVSYSYVYVRWGEWSDWSESPAEETEERQVETAEGWRSRPRQAQQGYRYSRWGEWSDWLQVLSLPEEPYETESRLQYRCRS